MGEGQSSLQKGETPSSTRSNATIQQSKNKIVAISARETHSETLHPDVEMLLALPRFKPLLRDDEEGIWYNDPANRPVGMDGALIGRLHSELRTQISALCDRALDAQHGGHSSITADIARLEQRTQLLVPFLTQRKRDLAEFTTEARTLPATTVELRKLRATLDKLQERTEILRSILPPTLAIESFETFRQAKPVAVQPGTPVSTIPVARPVNPTSQTPTAAAQVQATPIVSATALPQSTPSADAAADTAADAIASSSADDKAATETASESERAASTGQSASVESGSSNITESLPPTVPVASDTSPIH